jgi:hypothetical protein
MLLITRKKKFKTALKNFYTFIHFTPWKSTLVDCELWTVLLKIVNIVCFDLRYFDTH